MKKSIIFLNLILFVLLANSTLLFASNKYVVKVGSVAPEGTPWALWLGNVKKRMQTQSLNKLKLN